MKPLSSKKSPLTQWVSLCITLLLSVCVHAQPVANFSCSSVNGCAPILVSFTDQSTGNPTQWKWDLGNGTISYLQNPSVTYFNPGSYTVKLIVTSGAMTDSVVKVNYITVYAAPVVDFSASQTTACRQLNTIFTDQSNASASSITDWEWDFGDGIFSNLKQPSHTYDQMGDFNVTLKVKNSNGCSSSLLKKGLIKVNDVKASVSNAPRARCLPQTIGFYNSSTGNGTLTYKWYFGNGDSANVKTPVYNYPAPGNYDVRFLVTNSYGCMDSAVQHLTLDTAVSAVFSVDKQVGCSSPFKAGFSNQHLNGNSFLWKINDSVIVRGSDPVYTFRDTGYFDIKLVVTNSLRGCSDSLTKKQYIKVLPPSLNILNLPDSGCMPFTKTIKTDKNSGDSISTIRWNFGDGSYSNLASPTHTWSKSGYYDVTLIANKPNGCIDTIAIKKAIHVTGKPVAEFTADVTNDCAYSKVHFTNLSSASASKWIWEFNHGTTSEEKNPEYTFKDTGYVVVSLVALDGGCADTAIKNKLIYLKPSVAKPKVNFDCANPSLISFDNKSIGADTWRWNFGDGTTSTELNPVHHYSTPGQYSAYLETNNNTTRCYYLQTIQLNVLAHKINFFASDTVICKKQALQFFIVGDTASFSRYTWDMGDGVVLTSKVASLAYRYQQPGNYSVTLMANSLSNCTDTIIKQTYIRVNGPIAKFGSSTLGTCINTNVFFTDSTQTDKVNAINVWSWDYGDGKEDTLNAPPFTHIYKQRGDYKVTLITQDAAGCVDTFNLKKPISVKQLASYILPYDTLVCSGTAARMVTPYAEPGVSYRWEFGDGETANVQSPSHIYTKEGRYTIKVVVSHEFGCADSSVRKDLIRVENPVASFVMSDSFKACPPLLINFTNNSLNATDETWDFGDGTSTKVHSPSHFYSYPGEYFATLTVKSNSGCMRQMQRRIVVQGPKGSISYDSLSMCAPTQVNFKVRSIDAASYTWDFNDGAVKTGPDTIVTHTYKNPGLYVPKIMLMDKQGCRVPVTGTDTIHFASITGKFDFADKSLCDSGIVHFADNSITNDAIANCTWHFGDGTTVNGQTQIDHLYKNIGTCYPSFTVKTRHGCTGTYTSAVPVTVKAGPKISSTVSANGCAPLKVNLDAALISSNDPALSWHWDFGNGNTSSQQHPAQQVFPNGGLYTAVVTATASNGCVAKSSQTVKAFETPALITSPDTTICIGSSVKLMVSGAASYSWSDGTINCKDCSSISVTPTADTNYTVRGTSAEGCTSNKNIFVKVKTPFKIKVNSTAAVCVGKSVSLSATGAEKYQWYPSEGLNDMYAASPLASPGSNAIYKVIGTDNAGCFRDTAFVNVSVMPSPAVNAGADKTIDAGTAVDLIAVSSSDVTEVNWTPTGSIFRNDPTAITVKPMTTTEYTVMVKNIAGCTAIDKMTVVVNQNSIADDIFLPNTFSPNGDGINEIFYPRSKGLIKVKSLVIVNRHNEVVFEKYNFYANDANAGWSGLYRGTAMPADVFIYTISFEKADRQIQFKRGDIALIR